MLQEGVMVIRIPTELVISDSYSEMELGGFVLQVSPHHLELLKVPWHFSQYKEC